MSDDQPQDPNYPPPPETPTTAPQARYSSQYPQYPQYAQYPQYGQYPQHGQYPQYPPPGYPGYPPSAYRNPRPGTTIAAAVLGYIVGGFLILAAIILFSGASTLNDVSDELNSDASSVTAELTLDGFINLVAAGLLIAGGVMLTGRRRSGRTLLMLGGAVVLVVAVYWLVRAGGDATGFVIFWGGLFVAPTVVAMCLAGAPRVSQWLGS